MTVSILVVVDMQQDFVMGPLATPKTSQIVSKVCGIISEHKGPIIVTQDTHDESYPMTREAKFVTIIHCQKESAGWQLIPEVKNVLQGKEVSYVTKSNFASHSLLEEIKRWQDKECISSINFVGVCTDICVIANALLVQAFFPQVPIRINADACCGASSEGHKAALTVMSSCGIEVV